ncbi:MAG: DVU0298 family protein [Thermodesulfobacteriota bacterium]
MKTGAGTYRRQVEASLRRPGLDAVVTDMLRLDARKTVAALLSLLCHREELLRWRAVSALGAVVAALADREMEAARIVMRRFMWSLNDESGGIGWGIPESMGETMARQETLAREYHRILISYLRPDGNFIEYEMLQRGVLWGVGRLAQTRAHLLTDAGELLLPYFRSADPVCRGLSAWAAGMVGPDEIRRSAGILAADHAEVKLYLDGELRHLTVARLAASGGTGI